MKPTTSSATAPKVIKRSSGVQKKVATRNSESSWRSKRATTDDPQAHALLTRAEEIQETLSNEYPSFIKIMKPSHVSRGYWLGLPKPFCEVHLPKADTMIVLEDENGTEYEARYLVEKAGLSGGWRGFSQKHSLVEGDVLVFHLIQPSKFKVYIVKPDEVDVALSLLRLDGSLNQHDPDAVPQENDLMINNRIICDANMPTSDQPANIGDQEENLGLGVLNGNRLMRSITTFQQVTSMENFTIDVNSLVLDSKLPQHLRIKYYELCRSQQMFLHENILENQNCQLVIGMIREIINIADAIKASKITTPLHSFDLWYRKLKGLEMWGMNVSFLLARLEQLMRLSSKSEEYREARNQRQRAEEEKTNLELKLEEVNETIRRLDGQIDSQNLNLEMFEAEFHGLANAPW